MYLYLSQNNVILFPHPLNYLLKLDFMHYITTKRDYSSAYIAVISKTTVIESIVVVIHNRRGRSDLRRQLFVTAAVGLIYGNDYP